MALATYRSVLWPVFLLLCTTCVTSFDFDFGSDVPKTYWVDSSCEQKGISSEEAKESLHIASRGAKRLLNLNDDYQGWVYHPIFKEERDFSIQDDSETQAWDVVAIESWIGAMSSVNDRDGADVRIYCDNDARWTLVPNDPVSIREGMTPNSWRVLGEDAEYEDMVNFMRRDTGNMGCREPGTLGVSYEAVIPPDEDERVPLGYHSFRQTITICDLAFQPGIFKTFRDIPAGVWNFMRMDPLRLIPTNVLLYQLLNLEPYWISRVIRASFDTKDSWAHMLGMTRDMLEHKPGPFSWNAVLAYAADLGWGLQRDLTPARYNSGRDLFRYNSALINVPFIRGGPLTLPAPMTLPDNILSTK